MESNKQKIAGGLFWSYSERIMAQMVSLLVSIILARILTPDNYGVVSIVMIFITFCNAIVTGGFGNAIVQKINADELDVNTMLCCSMIVSIILYAVTFFAAPLIAAFYNMEIICPMLRVLGLRLLISGVNSIQRAWIQKRMLFKRFFISTSFGTVFSAIVGISMAYLGMGAWALVGQYLTNSFVDTMVLLLTNDWRPKLQFSWKRASTMLSYGWKVLATTVVYTIVNDLRSLIIGKKFGSADLAYYDQGQKYPSLIVTNINSSISSVIFPVLSQSQDNLARMKQICRRSIRVSTYILAPLLLGLVAVAESLVTVVLTSKWLPCVPYLQILTMVFLVRPFTSTCQHALMSIGRSDITLTIEIIINVTALAFLMVSVFVLESVFMIAVGSLLTEMVALTLFMKHIKNNLGYTYKEQLADVIPSLGLATSMACIVSFIDRLELHSVYIVLLQVFAGAVYYAVGSFVFKIEPYRYLISMLKDKMGKQR